MAKKKMTPSQAAAARRPDDWEPPVSAAPKKKQKSYDGAANHQNSSKDGFTWKWSIPVIIAAIVTAMIAPFIVIYVSNLVGLS